MSAKLVIIMWLYGSISKLNGTVLYPGDVSQQWTDFVTSLDTKFSKMESLLTAKDIRISYLETKLDTEMENKNSEIAQLKQDMKILIQTTDMLNKHMYELQDGKVEGMELNVDIEKKTPDVNRPEKHEEVTSRKGDNTTNLEIENNIIYDDHERMVDYPDGSKRLSEPTSATLKRYKRVAPSPTVAFHTKMSTPKTLTAGNTMIYDEETLDHGDGYNPRDGIYTVPVSGTYVMTWKVLSDVHNVIITALVVNGEVMGSSDTDSQDITDIHQATAIVVLTLNQGDHVFILVTGTDHGGMVSDIGHGKATFSGWKI